MPITKRRPKASGRSEQAPPLAWSRLPDSSPAEAYFDLFVFAPVPYARLDGNGIIEEINQAGCALFGDRALYLINRPFIVLVAKEYRSPFLEHMRRCRSQSGIIETDLVLATRDEKTLMVRISSKRSTLGGRVVYWTALVDLTERNDLIEARIEADAARRSAERQEQVARSLVEAKDQFLAMLSHELRTPLTPALVGASFLALQNLPPSVKEVARMIKRNIDLEVRLIDDLLDVTRIARGRLSLQFEAVDLRPLINEVIELCASHAAEKPQVSMVNLFNAEHSQVRADPTRLRQVMWNLINNAWKFTDRGHVTVTVTNPRPDVIHISVSDTGVGMDVNGLARLFRPFEQGDLENRRGGLGLGLAICKGIIDAHGGLIRATSAGSGRGSTFEIELPVVSEEEDARTERTEPEVSRKHTDGENVLVVDDHSDTAQMLGWLLEREGYVVTLADSVHEAEALIDKPWDIVITDLGLPDGSGVELGRRFASQSPRPRVFAISGWGMPQDLAATRAAGFEQHFVKPMDVKKLLALLKS